MSETTRVQAGGQRAKILIVDDHPAVAHAVAGLVQMQGFQTRVELNGEAAMEAIRSDAEISLVVLDVAMPGMSGIDVLRQLAAEGFVARVPIIMYSATEGSRNEAMDLGAVDFVSKGEPDLLLERIRRCFPTSAPSSLASP